MRGLKDLTHALKVSAWMRTTDLLTGHDRDAESPKQTRMKEERTRHRRTRDNKSETRTVTD